MNPSMPSIRKVPLVPYVPRRVHIAPVGFEVDRIVEPVLRMRGEALHLIAHTAEEDQGLVFQRQIARRLKEYEITPLIHRAPAFDLYSTIALIARLIRDHRRDEVFVNISSGSKVQALAGVLAAMLVEEEGLRAVPYYAAAERYSPPKGKPISTGCASITELPRLQLRAPPHEVKCALSVLLHGELSKTDLAVALAKQGIFSREHLTDDWKPRSNASRVSLQAAVDVRVVRRLQEWGFATTNRRGTKSLVALTEGGRAAAEFYSSTGDPAFVAAVQGK
jgi:hypothetical protein